MPADLKVVPVPPPLWAKTFVNGFWYNPKQR